MYIGQHVGSRKPVLYLERCEFQRFQKEKAFKRYKIQKKVCFQFGFDNKVGDEFIVYEVDRKRLGGE